MSIFGFGGSSASVAIEFKDDEDAVRHMKTLTDGDKETEIPIYVGSEGIRGTVTVQVPKGKKVEHLGVKVELIGLIGAWFGGEKRKRYLYNLAALRGCSLRRVCAEGRRGWSRVWQGS